MTESVSLGGDIIWRPSADQIERSHLTAFMRSHNIESYDELMQRSTTDVAWFTDALLKFLDIQFQKPYRKVMDVQGGIQFPQWCVGAELNITTNCLDKWLARDATRDRAAVIWEGEEGTVRQLTYGQLAGEVNRCANAMRSLGLSRGDAIGLLMPMTPEIVIALLAIARIGGVIIPLFSGYGVTAIASRLNDAKAKALFTADGFFRHGRVVELKPTADLAVAQVSSIEHLIVLRRSQNDVTMKSGRDHWWHELVDSQSDLADFEQTLAEDMLMIIYTSGTTGRPKGAVHTHCGFPIKAAQDMAFGTDVHAGDVVHWISDMGWMMGPWLVFGTTLLGATCLIMDGAPDYPEADRMWAAVQRHGMNVFGLSPSFVRAMITHGDAPVRKHDLSSLRAFASTGEPWNPDPWMWLFDVVGEGTRPIINYSGGTEISGGIVMGNPILPLKACAFSAACPGIAADVLGEDGRPIRNAVGELVIKAPWIGMTRGFWQDRQRYLDTYWSRWENVWVHGDFAAIDEDGLWYILGRSDDTIKVAGKRVGPSEIESILVGHEAVLESAAVGVPHEIKGSDVVCFCVLAPGFEGSDQLKSDLRARVGEELGKPLRPREVMFASDLPKTRNAKIMRRIVRAAYLGTDLGDTSSIGNPEAIEAIKNAT